MGNEFAKSNRRIARNLSEPQLSTPALTLSSEREIEQRPARLIRDNTLNTRSAVGGPLVASIEVRNANDHNKIQQQQNWAKEDPQPTRKQRQQKAADSSAACAEVAQEQEQQQQRQRRQQQRLKQASFWSLGSLNWNLSFSGRNSYKQRQKSLGKSFSTIQCHRRFKTQWHRPLTNAIFSSHFKESSRNGEFRIERLVAKGAFGVVFKVIDNKALQQQNCSNAHNLERLKITPAVYALKVLKKSKIISESSVQQIKDEADIQKLCGHNPFIVKQIDLWQNRHNLHILSEFVPNGELFSKISSFSLNLIRIYLAEIALALDFLHNAGIIYRDAKPENILLTGDYHLKLTDFGLSKWLKLGLTTNTICGTFQYMAPEILRGERYTHSVDWWSLGIIVCQMFVKKSPDIRQFITINLPKHLQPKDSVDNILQTSVEDVELRGGQLKNPDDYFPEEVLALPHEAKDVLKRLLEFDGQKRLHSVRALQKIAMYKDFKIEAKHIQQMRPLDVISADGILLYNDEEDQVNQCSGIDAMKAFKDF